MEKELITRKGLRLKNYDYSSKGAYFITICTKDRKQILSVIADSVGVGAHDDPHIQLTSTGKTAEKYLLSSNNISGVKIDRHVIMPDHIHAIIFLDPTLYSERKKRVVVGADPYQQNVTAYRLHFQKAMQQRNRI